MIFAFRLPQWVIWLIRLLIAGTFIYAGVIKVVSPARFAIDIDNYRLLPWALAVGLAFYLPWLEIMCGLAILCGFFYRGGLVILTALISGFIIASVIAKARGLDITCGCFGHASKDWSFTTHLALDLAILVVLIALWMSTPRATKRIVG